MGVQRKLNNTDPLMKPLFTALQNGLIERFGHVMESCEYRIATLHPKFKLVFLPSEEKSQIKEILDDLYSYLSHTEADSTITDEVEGYLAGF
ncbi:hypothetical protein BgiBS90_023988 [Biomphalaria glabrata]|nr:hypothetical protein BgiBS90_023988 [Biomphalaria glabrata]